MVIGASCKRRRPRVKSQCVHVAAESLGAYHEFHHCVEVEDSRRGDPRLRREGGRILLNTPQKSSTLSNVATFFRFELQSLAPSLFTAVARRGACSSVQGPGLQHVVLSPASKTDRVPRFRAVAAHADGHKCSARMDGAGILTIIEPQNPLVLQRVRHSIVHSRGCPPLCVAVCCGHFSRQNPNGEKPLPVLNPLRKYPAPYSTSTCLALPLFCTTSTSTSSPLQQPSRELVKAETAFFFRH